MKREEKINQASKSYASQMCDLCLDEYCKEIGLVCPQFRESLRAFSEGVKWADEHPVNVWHDASEEPERRNGGILCEHDLYYWVATQPYLSSICGNWHMKVKREHLKRWAYISDLLPKGGEE